MGKLRLTADEFAERIKELYNNRISIVKDTYKGTHYKVTAYCNVHKIFFEASVHELSRKTTNCPECSKERKQKQDEERIIPFNEMLQRFKEVYGEKFSYDESSYCGRKKLMKVHCNECDEDFEITPEHHLKYNNGGCPNCSKFKIVKCVNCGKDIIVDRHCKDDYHIICDECKEKEKKKKELEKFEKKQNQKRIILKEYTLVKCPFCGQYHKKGELCSIDLCNQFNSINDLKKLIPFGFDYSTIGSEKYIEEFDKATKLLLSEYYENKLSAHSIFLKYNCQEYFKCEGTLRYFIKEKLKQKTRNLSEAQYNAIDTGVLKLDIHSYQFKTEYHTSWEGKTFLLRSSYETDFANILDEQQTPYEVEALRIRYFDTQQQKERIAIPDFLLTETNTIIEVKSSWTFDKQNMLDKRDAYIALGYEFKLWYEHEFVDLDTM